MKRGALTETVWREFGARGFTKGGKIKVAVLKKLRKSASKVTRKRANFALNSRKWNKKGKVK